MLYGELRCEGTHTFVLSEMDGVVSHRQPHPPPSREGSRRQVEEIFQELGTFNVSHDNTDLGNILLTEDGAA